MIEIRKIALHLTKKVPGKGYFFMFWQAAFWVKVYIRFLWRNEVYKEPLFQKIFVF